MAFVDSRKILRMGLRALRAMRPVRHELLLKAVRVRRWPRVRAMSLIAAFAVAFTVAAALARPCIVVAGEG